MPKYRIYFVGLDSGCRAIQTVNCGSEVVTLAQERIRYFAAAEVWCGARAIGRIALNELSE